MLLQLCIFVVGLFWHMFRWGLEEKSFELRTNSLGVVQHPFLMLDAYPSLGFLGSALCQFADLVGIKLNASFKALSSSGLQASSCIKH